MILPAHPVAIVRGLSGAIDDIAAAIQRQEGWFPGSRAFNNNNPGNLMYVGQASATGADAQGFAIFPTYQAGYNELLRQINLDAATGVSFYSWFARYAPASAGNDPTTYARNVAASIGVDPNSSLASALDSTAGTVALPSSIIMAALPDSSNPTILAAAGAGLLLLAAFL